MHLDPPRPRVPALRLGGIATARQLIPSSTAAIVRDIRSIDNDCPSIPASLSQHRGSDQRVRVNPYLVQVGRKMLYPEIFTKIDQSEGLRSIAPAFEAVQRPGEGQNAGEHKGFEVQGSGLRRGTKCVRPAGSDYRSAFDCRCAVDILDIDNGRDIIGIISVPQRTCACSRGDDCSVVVNEISQTGFD